MLNIYVDVKHSKSNGFLWRPKSNDDKIDFEKQRLLHNGLLLRVNAVTTADEPRFLQAAFSGSGDQFVASDQFGKLYLFEIKANRYRLLTRLPSLACYIVWNTYRATKILISLNNTSLHYLDIITKCSDILVGHASPATYADIHSYGNFAVSNSQDEVIVWNLETCSQKKKLNIKLDAELIQAFFTGTDLLATCFKDNSIFMWNVKTFQCVTHLSPLKATFGLYLTFAISKNGVDLVAAGHMPELHLWDLNLGIIAKVIQLPSYIKSTKKIYVLDDWTPNVTRLKVLAIFSADNHLNLIDLVTATTILRISGYDSMIRSIVLNSSGSFAATLLESGCIDLYDLKVVASGKEAEVVQIVEPTFKDQYPSSTNVRSWSTRTETRVVGQRMHAGMDKDVELPGDHVSVTLDLSKLHNLLDTYGEYPERYRPLIWKFILQLPENNDSYNALERNGIHSVFEKLDEKFPLDSEKLMKKFKTILSCLAHWSPVFAYVEYLPLFIFPFVKSVYNIMQSFETVATILLNWCGTWFEFFPCPPMNVLKLVEQQLQLHDCMLLKHFTKHNIGMEVYAWLLLETAFSENFNKSDWLKLWDHIISNHPSFIVCVCAAYNIIARQSLLACNKLEEFQFFYHHQNPIALKSVLKEAYRIEKETSKELHPKSVLPDFRPLTKGTYPVFNKYPNYVVNFKMSEQDQLRKDEAECRLLKKATQELDERLKTLDHEEKLSQHKLDSYKEIGNKRREFLEKEEEQFALQKNKLLSLKRDMQLKELCILKTLRNKFSKEQQLKWQMEIQDLEYKIQAKLKQHEQEIAKAMSEVKDFQMFLITEKQNLELEIEKLQTQQAKGDSNKDPASFGFKTQYDTQQDDVIKSSQARYRDLIKADQSELTHTYETRSKLLKDRALDDSKVKKYVNELKELQKKNQLLEQEISNLTKSLIEYKENASTGPSEKENKLRAGVDSPPASSNQVPTSTRKDSLNGAFAVRQRLAYNMRTRYS